MHLIRSKCIQTRAKCCNLLAFSFIATKADVPFSSNEHTQHKSNINSNRFQLLQLPTTSIVQKRWILLICWSISASMLNIANELGWMISMANKSNANRIHWTLADAWLNVMHSSVMPFKLERNEKASSFFIPICSETNAIKPMPFFIKHLKKFAKIQTFFFSDWVPSLTKKFL